MQPTDKPKRVDSLTEEHRGRFAEWVAKWTAIGLSTERADRAKFERAVARCYQAAGLMPPKRVVWTTSPLVMAYAAPTAAFLIEYHKRASVGASVRDLVADSVGDSLRDLVADSVRDSVGASLRDLVADSVHASVAASVDASVGASVDASVRASVHASVDASVRASVHASVADSVHDSLRDLVAASVRASVHDSVADSVGASVRDITKAVFSMISQSWHRYIGGQFWVGGWYWGSPAYVSFFLEVCGLDLSKEMNERANAYAATAESACWWWPHCDFVMVCERPVRIERDEQGRLHSLTGKAIEWPDGWGFYRIHGVNVPGEIVEHPERITVSSIDAEANDEVRRIMVDRYGGERFLRDSGATKIQQDRYGTLYVREFTRGQPAVFVHLINSTPEADGTRREFWRRVHPELRPLLDNGQLGEPQAMTAHNAVASTYGMRGEEYAPLVET